MTVAQTILEQLGGNRFIAMTGAKNMVDHGNMLSFKIGRNASKVNLIRISLNGCDTYKIEFCRYRNFEATVMSEVSALYSDQLRSTFTRFTGMDCTL